MASANLRRGFLNFSVALSLPCKGKYPLLGLLLGNWRLQLHVREVNLFWGKTSALPCRPAWPSSYGRNAVLCTCCWKLRKKCHQVKQKSETILQRNEFGKATFCSDVFRMVSSFHLIISHRFHSCWMPRLSQPLEFVQPNTIWWRVQTMKPLIQFPPFPVTSSLLNSDILQSLVRVIDSDFNLIMSAVFVFLLEAV